MLNVIRIGDMLSEAKLSSASELGGELIAGRDMKQHRGRPSKEFFFDGRSPGLSPALLPFLTWCNNGGRQRQWNGAIGH